MRKIIILLLLLSYVNIFAIGKAEQKYLVYIFNKEFYQEPYTAPIHRQGDYLWIVAIDTCGNSVNEKELKPLFTDSFQLDCLSDSDYDNIGFGEFPVEYSKDNHALKKLYKNRKLIYTNTSTFNYPKSKDILNVYCVPIIAECSTHTFGFYKKTIMAFDNSPKIWDEFWRRVRQGEFRKYLFSDFSQFDFVISLSDE